ncbi:MAG: AIR synthase-related protein [Acetobacteraceae bacterium]
MRQTNAAAAEILRAHGVTACTDVTGFGVAGHLLEMLRASAVGAVIRVDDMPVLPGALELAGQGVESTLAAANRAALPPGARGPRRDLLADPQTSGGLLAGVPARRVEACLAALHEAGMQAAVIGVVDTDGVHEGGPIRIV